MMRVCIIGSGLTGAVAAATLRLQLPAVHIQVWDKAAKFGLYFMHKTMFSYIIYLY